jgi:hypothetical protein
MRAKLLVDARFDSVASPTAFRPRPTLACRRSHRGYYEELACFLVDNQQLLSILLPNKVKHSARSTELKSETD